VISAARTYLSKPVSTAPLAILRIAFGLLMVASVSRFILNGWIETMYIQPKIFFPYYGFEWVKPLPGFGMYVVFGLLFLSAIGILLGAFYRLSVVTFFLLFSYVELIDKTNYLNHYYFISLVAFLLLFVPAGHCFSLDNIFRKRPEMRLSPRWHIFILQLQMFIVYFFAGVAKLNTAWLLDAQPLKIWLPAFSHYPLIGPWLEQAWVAYAFSWFACLYDLSIGFLLFNRRTVNVAYVFVVVFHLATALFFNIGMFPFIMMTITIIFFRESFHEKVLNALKRILNYKMRRTSVSSTLVFKPALAVLVFFFCLQLVLPFRYLFYKGDLFWTELGYRFSWRVMLMEKAGSAFFQVKDKRTGRSSEVDNKDYLTYMQEKMMSTQPDMMVDYAKFLRSEYTAKGYQDPEVNVLSYVTVNGSGSREFIDPSVDLAAEENSLFDEKVWVKSY
jgi:hypothetical protein